MLRAVSASTLIAAMLVPSLTLAQTNRERIEKARSTAQERRASSTPNGQGGKNFCDNIDTVLSKMNEVRGDVRDGRDEKRETRDAKMADKRGTKTAALDDRRASHDENRSAAYEKMYSRATTTEQKAAVDTFKAAVEAAVAKRKAAVDAAITAYRSAVDKLLSDRRAAVDSAAATHKSAIEAAQAKAKADCASGVDPATVRSSLRNSIQEANIAFKEAAKRPEDLKQQVEALRDTRDAAVKAALDTFKAEYETAKNALKAALGR